MRRRPFVYTKRTPEMVDRLLRRHALERACRDRDTAKVCKLLRAEGYKFESVAALIELLQHKLGTRALRPLQWTEEAALTAEAERDITAEVRHREGYARKRNGGKLPRKKRPSLVDEAIARRAEDGELEGPWQAEHFPGEWVPVQVNGQPALRFRQAWRDQRFTGKPLPISRERILNNLRRGKRKQKRQSSRPSP
jgi:hypothetical protein